MGCGASSKGKSYAENDKVGMGTSLDDLGAVDKKPVKWGSNKSHSSTSQSSVASDHQKQVMMDRTHDGKVDTMVQDTNEDGHYDTMMTDTKGDGKMDKIMVDTTKDGKVDTIEWDTTGDGKADLVQKDTTGDGQVDQEFKDTKGNGRPDLVKMDTNGDGVFNRTEKDTTGDGTRDLIELDTTGDGQVDFKISITGPLASSNSRTSLTSLESKPADPDAMKESGEAEARPQASGLALPS